MMMQLSGEKQVNRTQHEPLQSVPSSVKANGLREQALGHLAGLVRFLITDHDVDKVILSESGGMAIEL